METRIECTPRKLVLKRCINEKAAQELVDTKKTSAFKSLLGTPKKDEIHTHSIRTVYEATTMLRGNYSANYYRKAEHTIKVDHNVKRVEIGDGVFNVQSKSRIGSAMSGARAKRKVVLSLEEYVTDNRDGAIFIDHHGIQVSKFAHSTKSAMLEPYPKRVLDTADMVRDSELTQDALVGRLCEKLTPVLDKEGVRNLQDKAVIQKIYHIYVPVIEAKLVGPKKRIRMLRIDAVSKKVLKV